MMASVELNPPLTRKSPWRRLLWPLLIAMAGIAALSLDLPIAWWFHDGHCPAEIHRWLAFAEVYAHGFGVTCILLTIFALDRGRRHLLPRAAAIAFGGGLVANLLKLTLARARPHDFLPKVPDGFVAALSTSHAAGLSIFDTFGQWLPLGKVASGFQSFPSGHMATAFGLTAALIWLYPRAMGVRFLRAVGRLPADVEPGAFLERRVLGGGRRLRGRGRLPPRRLACLAIRLA